MDVIAPSTDSLFTRDLMLLAVPYSSASIFATREICTQAAQVWQHQIMRQSWFRMISLGFVMTEIAANAAKYVRY